MNATQQLLKDIRAQVAAYPYSLGYEESCLPKIDKLAALIEEERKRSEAAQRTLIGMGYYWNGGEYWRQPATVISGKIAGDDDNPIFIPGD